MNNLTESTDHEGEVKGTLYIKITGQQPSPHSWAVIFLHQFCLSKQYNIVQVDTQGDITNGINTLHLPADTPSSTITLSELPDVVASCELPALVASSGLVCYTGMCTVLRRLVIDADWLDPSRNLIALLGFKQTCLRTCSEVSLWTKLCEVQVPRDIADILKHVNAKRTLKHGQTKSESQNLDILKSDMHKVDIPESIQKLEKILCEPVTTFNIGYRQQMMNKEKTQNDIKASQETLDKSGICLKATYKNAVLITDKRKYKEQIYGKKSREEEQAASKELNQGMSKLTVQTTNSNIEEKSQKNELKFDNLSQMNQNDEELLSDLSRSADAQRTSNARCTDCSDEANVIVENQQQVVPKKKEKKKNHDKKPAKLAVLEHTYAEGPDLTLTDIALFPYVQWFLQYSNLLGATDALGAIPRVIRWYKQMVTVPNIVETCVACGIEVVKLETEQDNDIPLEQKPTNHEGEYGKGKSKKAVKKAVMRDLPIILDKLQGHDLAVEFSSDMNQAKIDWESLPKDVNPSENVDAKRAKNKRNQVESLVAGVKMVAKDGHTIVDFCSGGGHVGIVIAYLLPTCHVIMIENKEESLRRAAQRVDKIGLNNVTFYNSNIDYYTGKFDVGVSLHACGVATDLVLSKCLHHQAAFVSSPCCYGGLQDTHQITYPRSQRYKSAGISCEDLCTVGHGAEQTSWDFDSQHAKQGKLCMGIIDTDRMYAAMEQGYSVTLCSLQPATCSPKNNLLIGWHKK